MKRKYKVIMGSIIAVIILGVSLSQFTRGIEATLLEVKPQAIVQSFKEEGKVIPKIDQPIYAPYPHEITELVIVEGQRVEQGDVLVKLDTKDLEFQLRQLQNQVLTSREENSSAIRIGELLIAQLELQATSAQRSFQQYEQLYNAGAVSKQEYDQAKENLEIIL